MKMSINGLFNFSVKPSIHQPNNHRCLFTRISFFLLLKDVCMLEHFYSITKQGDDNP